MTKHKFSQVISTNWVRFISTPLLSCLLLSTTISLKPASAAESLFPKNSSYELTTNNKQTVLTDLNLKPEAFAVEFSKPLKLEKPKIIAQTDSSSSIGDTFVPANKLSDIQQQKPKTIAQTDSSGSVGDTFGESNKLRQELLIEPIVEGGKPPLVAAPSSSAGTPTAYGANWGQAFIGGGLYFPFDGDVDGSLSVGFGLGNSVQSVGLEVATNIISVGGQEPNFGDFGDSGTIGLKLHKYLPNSGTGVAIGWSNAIKWGEADIPQETIYGVVTQQFQQLTASVGVGTGSYRSKGARNSGDNDLNLFGSLGYRLSPAASLISSWTGSSLNLGASFVPLKQTPLVVNAIFTDVSDNINSAGFSLSAGYSFQF
ncbi:MULTISPECIES: hypothetical protein [unclassified Anabaena]|uniref:hypothetical protein n=1 Tax=unclassified Anabaena TaxID=2619674 RepID=UPI001444BFAB|nr:MULTISPECIES: hypothetical protein [unclassified Anabaena]MTJ07541.1 hypothetical protein [Anabaena sp. UHCC 0204]MTJ52614.1 hypothetical protein [Anabaena sp. UHCC 0253]